MTAQWKIAFVLGVVACLSGCLMPPVPMKRRMETPNIARTKLDFTFIKPGVTMRAEVDDRLRAIDSGVSGGMFWGRFNESSWSDPSASGPGGRTWGRQNLVITYNEKGVVETSRTVGEKEMNRILLDWLASGRIKPQPDTTLRVKSVRGYERKADAEISLKDGEFMFVEEEDKARHTVAVSPEKITRIQASAVFECCIFTEMANTDIQQKIWIDTLDLAGNPLLLQMSPANAVALLDYVRKHCPGVKYE